jgi:putative transcriptional regulator
MTKGKRMGQNTSGRRILGALKEALAIERGEATSPHESRRIVTARAAVAGPAPQYDAGEVKNIRYRLEVSQPVFAQLLNVSPETVRAWEQGKNPPSGPAARLLELADSHPEWLLKSVEVR